MASGTGIKLSEGEHLLLRKIEALEKIQTELKEALINTDTLGIVYLKNEIAEIKEAGSARQTVLGDLIKNIIFVKKKDHQFLTVSFTFPYEWKIELIEKLDSKTEKKEVWSSEKTYNEGFKDGMKFKEDSGGEKFRCVECGKLFETYHNGEVDGGYITRVCPNCYLRDDTTQTEPEKELEQLKQEVFDNWKPKDWMRCGDGPEMNLDDAQEIGYRKGLIKGKEIKSKELIDGFLEDIYNYLDSDHTDPCDLDSHYWKKRKRIWQGRIK